MATFDQNPGFSHDSGLVNNETGSYELVDLTFTHTGCFKSLLRIFFLDKF